MRRTRLEKATPIAPSKNKKKRTTLWLEHEQIESLRVISAQTGVPQAVMLRRGVDYAIQYFAEALFSPVKEPKT